MAGELVCGECGAVSGILARGWIAVRCEDPDRDEHPKLAFFCPSCVRAGLDGRIPRHDH
jgi:hypothetical protein